MIASGIAKTCETCSFPAQPHDSGFLCFAGQEEVDSAFAAVAKFKATRTFPLTSFVEEGADVLGLKGRDTSNIVHSMFRQGWNSYCRTRGLLEFGYSKGEGFHVAKEQSKLGGRMPWGRQGERRWSMLRNVAKGYVWQYGVSAIPSFWPYYHFKLKSRVLFSPLVGEESGDPFEDSKKQHRLRRSICKGWRNKQWHGRLLAFLELMSAESAFIRIPLANDVEVVLEASPLLFTSPVSTPLPDQLQDDQEEQDQSTLGRPEQDEES